MIRAFLFVATDRTCAHAICVIDSSSQVPEPTGRSKWVLGYVTTKVTRGTLNRYIVPLWNPTVLTQNNSNLLLMVLLQQTKCAQLFCILSALATLSCIESQDIFFIPRIFRFSSDLAYPPLNFGNWVHIRVHCKCFKNFLASYKLCTTFTEINNTKRLNPKSLRKDWWKYIPSITSNSRTFIKMLKKSRNRDWIYYVYQTNANK